MKTPVLVIYDIRIDKIRNRLAKELLRYGIRTQKSLFEAKVTEGEMKQIREIVNRYASYDPDDTLAMYVLEPGSYGRTIRLGNADYISSDDFVI